MSESLDWYALPLPAPGTTLIEASAGTGKTFTIAAIVARLITEGHTTVDRILVVTFTRAATQELRERIRGRLVRLLDRIRALRVGAPLPECDAFEKAWRARLPKDEVGLLRVALRLSRAVREVDLAPITTIHGFCQRALREHAFETALPVDLELVDSVRAEIDRLARDVAIAELAALSEPLVATLRADFTTTYNGGSVALKVIELAAAEPERSHLPRAAREAIAAFAEADRAWVEAGTRFAKAWREGGGDVVAWLGDNPEERVNGHRKKGFRAVFNAFDAWATSVVEGGASGRPPQTLQSIAWTSGNIANGDDALGRITPARVQEQMKANERAPEHAVFVAAQRFRDARFAQEAAAEQAKIALRTLLVEHARTTLAARLQRAGLQSFDAILNDTRAALQSSPTLPAALAKRYDVALIDEFQDTNATQYDIFRLAFGERASLFFIGDPKQAIYSFRGADVFVYMEAAARATRRYHLDTNFRSDPGVLSAVNALFAAPRAFGLEGIAYAPVKAAPGASDGLRRSSGEAEPPCRVAVFDAGAWTEAKHTAQGNAHEPIAAWVASDIAARGRDAETLALEVGGVALGFGDIAVLVQKHVQAQAVQAALRARGVPSVRASSGEVFESDEREQVGALLLAIAQPTDPVAIRRALVTPLLGRRASDLVDLLADDAAWDALVERFARWRRRWTERGFMSAFEALLREEGVAARVLRSPGGERSMTNVLHLAERVHVATLELGLGVAGTLRWWDAGHGDARGGAELRTETESRAVQIVTMHAAKGLEYGVVYAPFLSKGRGSGRSKVYRVHATDTGEDMVWMGGKNDALEQASAVEQRAERIRLAYVAMTRAKHQLVVVARESETFATSPLGSLFAAAGWAPGDARAGAAAWSAALPDAVVVERCEAIDSRRRLTRPTLDARSLSAREARGPWSQRSRIGSFSRLIANAQHTGDDALRGERDDDATNIQAQDRENVETDGRVVDHLPDLPGGTQTGSMIHAIFEHASFAKDDQDARRAIVRDVLPRYGFDPDDWTERIHGWIERTLETPLGGFRLSDLDQRDRIDELAFLLPSRGVTPARIAAVLREHGDAFVAGPVADQVGSLSREGVAPYLRGFVDLVARAGGRYYVVDYKTNDLRGADAYAPKRLELAMLHGHYALQALLYATALHRWLGARWSGYDPAAHLGGIRYLFLRGMGPGSSAGVFSAPLSPALVCALDALFPRP